MSLFFNEYDISHCIDFILDDEKKQDKLSFGNKVICVITYSDLPKIITKKTVIIIVEDYPNEIMEKLALVVNVKATEVYLYMDSVAEKELFYKRKYERCPLTDTIVFRSGPRADEYVAGMDFADNAKALFDYMLQQRLNFKWELVWFVNEPDEFKKEYADYANVRFIPWNLNGEKNREESYYQALFTAKYIFFTDAYGFARNVRKGQIRVQLWHGCGFKTRLNFSSCERRYEYMIVTSELYAKVHADVFGLRNNQMLVTGLPKEDWLFNPIDDWKEMFNIPEAKHYIFWLPTYRLKYSSNDDSSFFEALPLINSMDEMLVLSQTLKCYDAVLIIKLHPFQKVNYIIDDSQSNIIIIENDRLARKHLHINCLLGHADALISDYSSVAVDYMLLDKPIAFTVDDCDEYSKKRGFIWNNIREYLPGVLLKTFNDMLEFIQLSASNIDENYIGTVKRRNLLKRFHKYVDNNNSKRVLEKLGIIETEGFV